VITFAQDEKIKGQGVANEGIVSTGLGLKESQISQKSYK
jgi:dihydroorotase